MPWQRLVADVGLELLDGGRPAYREVVILVPRQSGKTTLTLSWQLHRALMWGSRSFISYGASDGNAARKKLLEDQWPGIEASPIKAAVKTVRRAAGQEGIWFKNGSRIEVFGSSVSAGHGRTIDLAIGDEVWADYDDRREQALIPAMATRPEAQLIVVSTAGTEASTYLRRKVDAGRAAVLEGLTSGIAYFEWSADDGAPIDDPATWRSCMPALGYTISEEVVAHALRSMAEAEFRRAFLNEWTKASERVISAEAWQAVCRPVELRSVAAFGVDVNPERTFSTVVAVEREGRAELLKYGAGTHYVVDYVADLVRKHRGTPVAIDPSGPAGTLVPDLEQRRVKVVKVAGRDLAAASGRLYDAIADQTISVRNDPHLIEPLDLAVADARKRPLGDAWAWARKDVASDICPLVALTVAWWAAVVSPPKRKLTIY